MSASSLDEASLTLLLLAKTIPIAGCALGLSLSPPDPIPNTFA